MLKESSALGSQTAVSCPAGAGRSLTALELSAFSPTDRLSSTLSPCYLHTMSLALPQVSPHSSCSASIRPPSWKRDPLFGDGMHFLQLKLLLFDYLRISSMFSDKFASHPSLNSFFPTVCSRSCLTLFSPPHQVRLYCPNKCEAPPSENLDCPFLRSHKLPVTPNCVLWGLRGCVPICAGMLSGWDV